MSNLPPVINYATLKAVFEAGYQQLPESEAKRVENGGRQEIGRAELIAFVSAGLQALEKAQDENGHFVSVDDRAGSLLQTLLASHPERLEVASLIAGTEAKFDPYDLLGWGGSLFDWVKGLKKHAFVTHHDAPAELGSRCRIALLSDWGTGMYGAPVCAASIEEDRRFDMLMHLGDVYYSGDIDEVEKRFLNKWPQVPGAVSRALNSNHEMYSGGYGYFDKILPAFGQSASYFAYRNPYWLLVALDTGYTEHDLYGQQAEWLTDLVRNAGDRRVVLFTHHQPFSLFEPKGEKLLGKLGRLLDAQKIFAWYWGHEHRCALYDKHPLWQLHGRCIGHSGFPYFRDKFKDESLTGPGWISRPGKNLVPGAQVLDGPNPYLGADAKKYGPNGYVVLEFNDRDLTERIMDADGTLLRTTLLD